MLNKKFWLGMMVMVLVFGMTVFGCKDDPEDNGNNGDGGNTNGNRLSSTFILTNIPSKFNGKYAILEASNGDVFLGGGIITSSGGLRILISNGRVSLPMWIGDRNFNNYERYYGNDTVELWVYIYNSEDTNSFYKLGELIFNTVTFKNGSAIKSFNDCDEYHDYNDF
jgi:hypothetical protein